MKKMASRVDGLIVASCFSVSCATWCLKIGTYVFDKGFTFLRADFAESGDKLRYPRNFNGTFHQKKQGKGSAMLSEGQKCPEEIFGGDLRGHAPAN